MVKYDDQSKFGEPGSLIPGSKSYRAYCTNCGGAMRVRMSALDTEQDIKQKCMGNICLDCQLHTPPPAHTGLEPRQKMGCVKTGG